MTTHSHGSSRPPFVTTFVTWPSSEPSKRSSSSDPWTSTPCSSSTPWKNPPTSRPKKRSSVTSSSITIEHFFPRAVIDAATSVPM